MACKKSCEAFIATLLIDNHTISDVKQSPLRHWKLVIFSVRLCQSLHKKPQLEL
jgi:hypothetical protein